MTEEDKAAKLEEADRLYKWSMHTLTWILENNKPENTETILELFDALMTEHQKYGFLAAKDTVNSVSKGLLAIDKKEEALIVGIVSASLTALFEANYNNASVKEAYQRAKEKINATNI